MPNNLMDLAETIEKLTEEKHRWTKTIAQVSEIKDNRFFVVGWGKGLAESQSDKFFDDTINEVKPAKEQITITVWKGVNKGVSNI